MSAEAPRKRENLRSRLPRRGAVPLERNWKWSWQTGELRRVRQRIRVWVYTGHTYISSACAPRRSGGAPGDLADGTGVRLYYVSRPATSRRMPSDIVICKLRSCLPREAMTEGRVRGEVCSSYTLWAGNKDWGYLAVIMPILPDVIKISHWCFLPPGWVALGAYALSCRSRLSRWILNCCEPPCTLRLSFDFG